MVVLLIVIVIFSGCSKEETRKGYEDAIANLQQTAINEDGVYEVTEDLLMVLHNTEFTEPQNIIYMIGDGMGENVIQATQEVYAEELYENKLAMNHLTKVGTQSTYSANSKITDSAAGGTALATGKKTSNYTVAMDKECISSYETVLELAAEKGKSTGIIATKSVTDATPAAFTTHVEDREMQVEIAGQQLKKIAEGTLDLILGGGKDYYENSENAEAFSNAEAMGMSYNLRWEDAVEDKLPLVGLFAGDALNTVDSNTPTLTEMTDLALQLLSQDKNGFFLMVEGSQIDTKAHANLIDKEVYEVHQFDSAVAVAMKFVALHPDTVLIVTADHETGGLYFPQEGYVESGKHIYNTGDHTNLNVPVYAVGYGTNKLGGIMENTDIAGFVASLLGEEDFEQKSEIKVLYDTRKSKGIKMSFDVDISSRELLTKEMKASMCKVKNARAIHLTIKNLGKEKVSVPALKFSGNFLEVYEAVSQGDYIDAGETLQLTYVLPIELWNDNMISNIDSIQVTYDAVSDNAWRPIFGYYVEEAEIEIQEIAITERDLEK